MRTWQKWAAAALLWYIVGVFVVVAVLAALPAQASEPFTGKVIGGALAVGQQLSK